MKWENTHTHIYTVRSHTHCNQPDKQMCKANLIWIQEPWIQLNCSVFDLEKSLSLSDPNFLFPNKGGDGLDESPAPTVLCPCAEAHADILEDSQRQDVGHPGTSFC